MNKRNTYLQLMRLNQPTGFLLLFWPCSFGLAIADNKLHVKLLILFFFGSIVMRAAGCIVNDIIDRDLDRQVERTKNRPLATGTISVMSALLLLAILLSVGALFLFSLNKTSIMIGLCSTALIALYPFMKRITSYPQAALAVTFNIGALIAYAAVASSISANCVILYVACGFWTLGYDTIYGYQDYKDDQKVGIKSTSLTFLKNGKMFIRTCYIIMTALLTMLGALSGYGMLFYLIMLAVFGCLVWQVVSLNQDSQTNCLKRFKANGYLGAAIFLALVFR